MRTRQAVIHDSGCSDLTQLVLSNSNGVTNVRHLSAVKKLKEVDIILQLSKLAFSLEWSTLSKHNIERN